MYNLHCIPGPKKWKIKWFPSMEDTDHSWVLIIEFVYVSEVCEVSFSCVLNSCFVLRDSGQEPKVDT